jgi:hypothetical protein
MKNAFLHIFVTVLRCFEISLVDIFKQAIRQLMPFMVS